MNQAADTNPFPTILPASEQREQPFPLTDIQQAYWVGRSGEFELGNVATHSYQEMTSVGLDLERFERALQQLIRRTTCCGPSCAGWATANSVRDAPTISRSGLAWTRGSRGRAGLEAVRQEMSHQVLPSDRWPLFDIAPPAGRGARPAASQCGSVDCRRVEYAAAAARVGSGVSRRRHLAALELSFGLCVGRNRFRNRPLQAPGPIAEPSS